MKTLKLLLLSVTLIFCISAFSQSTDYELIEMAYKTQNDSLLRTFFANWELNCNKKSIQNVECETDVNHLFQLFYDPANIQKISGISLWDSLYMGVQYFIVQNNVAVYLVNADSLQRTGKYKDSDFRKLNLKDFRPTLQYTNARVLCLMPEFEKVLIKFLGTPGKDYKTKANNKLTFLSKYVKIVPSSEKTWYLETHPLVEALYFNKSRKLARIDFRLLHQGGSAYFVKEAEQWRIIWSGITWKE